MDAVNPWLDPSEVRQLAEQLLRPVAPARATTDPGFDSSFVGFTEDDQTSTSVAEPQTQEKVPLSASPIHQPITESSFAKPARPSPPPPASRPGKKLLDRIEIFSYWLANNYSASETFLLDHEGKVILDQSEHGRLHFMARNLALASRFTPSIHLKIGPSAILQLITCETPDGRIVLGTLVPAPLPSDQIRTISQLLVQSASPE